ncbi:pantothenate kinase [Aetokthonos hydrillicola Thurmond2011]|uniref:Type III pantothenate kinase n=2 Tax=Aetokthonos TaxID=1550243 RepID=A0AAP5M8I9_9CYAN|nr:pantothenate kinase [Aetokthonos hydrillicola Thurmond2011]
MIGNSRLHWSWFVDKAIVCAWDTDYLPEAVIEQLAKSQTLEDLPPEIFLPIQRGRDIGTEKLITTTPEFPLPLYLASVVPSETRLWQTYPNVQLITLEQVPLEGMYPTLGIDRALALWGAGQNWSFPVLVIDAGTALTFTGADSKRCLVGGAILPGFGLQFATLGGRTGQLPNVTLPQQLPKRYALNTQEAIHSGVIYTIVAGVKDFIQAWWELFAEGNVVVTGGDRIFLLNYLQYEAPDIAERLKIEANLVFLGMRQLSPFPK